MKQSLNNTLNGKVYRWSSNRSASSPKTNTENTSIELCVCALNVELYSFVHQMWHHNAIVTNLWFWLFLLWANFWHINSWNYIEQFIIMIIMIVQWLNGIKKTGSLFCIPSFFCSFVFGFWSYSSRHLSHKHSLTFRLLCLVGENEQNILLISTWTIEKKKNNSLFECNLKTIDNSWKRKILENALNIKIS